MCLLEGGYLGNTPSELERGGPGSSPKLNDFLSIPHTMYMYMYCTCILDINKLLMSELLLGEVTGGKKRGMGRQV